MERRDREYRTLGFDTRKEEMEMRKYREEERRKSLLEVIYRISGSSGLKVRFSKLSG